MSTYQIPLVNGAYDYDVETENELEHFHRLYFEFTVLPVAGTLTVQIQYPGSANWVAVPELTGVALTALLGVPFVAPLGRIRFTVAGVSGGSGLKAHLYSSANWFGIGMPDELFIGIRAMTTQNYVEANVKNGVQWEVSTLNTAFPTSAQPPVDYVVLTGAKPIAIKGRVFTCTGLGLTTTIYADPVYTGGVNVPYFNLNFRNPAVGLAQIIGGPTLAVSSVGTQKSTPRHLVGSSQPGVSALATHGQEIVGLENILAPNTAYLFRTASLDTEVQIVSSYNTWYEGDLDLPRPA